MVGMAVGEQDALAAEALALQQLQRPGVLQAGVEHQRGPGVATAQHVAVLVVGGVDDDRQLDEVTERFGHGRASLAGGDAQPVAVRRWEATEAWPSALGWKLL
jgi:hypothetical protein